MKSIGFISLSAALLSIVSTLITIPLYAGSGFAQGDDSGSAAPAVEIPVEKRQLIGVRVTEALRKDLTKTIRTVGRIEYDERRLATVNTKVEGWLERLYVDYTGRYVKKGEAMAEIYSPELLATQAEYLNLLKTLKRPKQNSENIVQPDPVIGGMLEHDAETIVNAARRRLKLWDITEAQIKKIEQKGEPLRTLTIYSPVGGFVIQKNAIQGMKVMPGEKLFDVADLSTLWVIADVYENELPAVKVGDKATISLSYYPGKEFISKVDYIYPTLSSDTRTAKVRLLIANPNNELRTQMFTNVELKVNLGVRLAVPLEAVIDTGTRQVVYVDKGDGYFEPRLVKTGLKADGMVEIREGLKEHEKVASSASFLIDSESQLKGIFPLENKK